MTSTSLELNVKKSLAAISAVFSAVLLSTATVLNGADLVLAEKGRTDCQIVLPEAVPGAVISQALDRVAAVMQEMFKSNGSTVPVVKESQADKQKPGIYLGDTALARAAGVEGATLPVWAYAWKTAGKNVIISGRDWGSAGANYSLGTVKGATDFMRQFCGTRFLTPGGLTGIEFLPTATIAVPEDLNLHKKPMVDCNALGGGSTDIGTIALNFLNNVTTEYFGHTHEIAVSASAYLEKHPEYFALVNGKRLPPHLCYASKQVQEIIYKDMLRSLDAGYPAYLSGQADGFRACGCDECKTMFGTSDWGEKLWLLNKQWADRLLKDRPGKFLEVLAYTVTGSPPSSFKEFPPNLRVSVGGSPKAFEAWNGYKVPGGFTTYLHAWGGYHLCGYLPIRTPLYCEKLVKMFDAYNVKGVGLDGPPANMWGLEGPAIYVYSRMLDDAKNNTAVKLVEEYIQAAYGRAAPAMRRFFDELNHTLEAYSEVFGVDNGTFQTYTRVDGRSVRYLTSLTKLRLIGFLYPPETLELLESNLAQAEKTAGLSEKNKLRLALARREFDYLKSTARAVHLYQAYRTRPDKTSLAPLLTEMEARETMILSWCDTNRPYGGHAGLYTQKPFAGGWPVYIGGQGVLSAHLIGNGGSYLSDPVAPFTWNLADMRNAQSFEGRTLSAQNSAIPLALASAEWGKIPGEKLGPLTLGAPEPTLAGEVKVAYDAKALYVRFGGRLPDGWSKPTGELQRDDDTIVSGESFNVLLAPDGNPAKYYRLAGGPVGSARYDARQGFIEDSIDPRFNQDDVTWNPEWTYECAVSTDSKNWSALLVIPFASLGTPAPAAGTEWKANFGRIHQSRPGMPRDISLWSSTSSTKVMADRGAFGKIVFETEAASGPAKNPLEVWRDEQSAKHGEFPAEWKTLPHPLPTPLGPWVFRTDPSDEGLKGKWFAAEVTAADWVPVKVPGFWAETEEVGNYQGVFGWYRTTFTVPAEWKGKSLRLLFAAIDEQAWIYVNGKLIREHSVKSEGKPIDSLWDESFAADVPSGGLNYGQTNVLAVRVENSTGNGGIWRPVLAHGVQGK
jgi:hypothetical protein